MLSPRVLRLSAGTGTRATSSPCISSFQARKTAYQYVMRTEPVLYSTDIVQKSAGLQTIVNGAPTRGEASSHPFDAGSLPSSESQAIWRATEIGQADQSVVSSGFPALDAQLPGGGWRLRVGIFIKASDIRSGSLSTMPFRRPLQAAGAECQPQ